ncbi:MAG: hypothetical protein JSV05_07575 [Candidatus Bathyarchaeota archaeon]|nr:MAG: hypothetical protein JSV05_07575 [Candidatus Bathyarchaeota archaeon]
MNAQLPITTPPKYNFPLPSMHAENLQLPKQFVELSLRSLKKLENTQQMSKRNSENSSLINENSKIDFPRLIRLKPNQTSTPVMAIDVSSIKIGETETGLLLAIRGAIIWKHANRYQYLRIGPFPFHIYEENKNLISSILRNHSQLAQFQDFTIPNSFYIQSRLTAIFERWIQTSINQITNNSLILFDGSLASGSFEHSLESITQMLRTARSNQNIILAFSKMTRLVFRGQRLTDLILKHPPPCLLKMANYFTNTRLTHFFGSVYVAKLSGANYAFRLDIDNAIPEIKAIEAVKKLLGNDLILQSYPETLRLAHIYSTFTAAEVLGIQRWISQEADLRIITKPNLRRLLFGRFGKGPEG